MLRRVHGLTTAFQGSPSHSRPRWPVVACRPYSHDVAVLGGGITGLATAYYLTRDLPQAKVTIYEASDRLGGWLSSRRVPVKDGTVLFEAGPRTLRPKGNGVLSSRLLQELDLAKHAIFPQSYSVGARNRYLYYPDHLVRMPHPAAGMLQNVSTLMSEPIFEGLVWAGLTEYFKKARDPQESDESVGSFFSRRYSTSLVNRILSAIIHGIYAGDVWQLSAKSLFPGPWRYELDAGSVVGGMLKSRAEGLEVTKREAEFLKDMTNYHWEPVLGATLRNTAAFTFTDGLATLTDTLARHLMGTGKVEFKSSTTIEAVHMLEDRDGVSVYTNGSRKPTHFANAISTVSPAKLNAVTQEQTPRLLPHIPSVTVMTVNLYYRTPNLAPAGFGYLIPQDVPFENNPERALGVVFDTAYSPSPEDVNSDNWGIKDPEDLKAARQRGQLINVNDFAWYNTPDPPNAQDKVRARGTKLTVMLGGHWWDGWTAYPDEKDGLALAKSLLQRHLGIKEEPEAWQANLQSDCIPQYMVGHEAKLRTAHNNLWREYRGRLRVAGSWTAGVGVNDCLRSAWDVVRSLRDGRDGTGLEHVGVDEYVRVELAPIWKH